MKVSRIIWVGLVAAVAGTVAASAAPLPPVPELEDYLDWSVAHHPALEADRERAAVLREEGVRAGALPGLRLAWGEMIVPVETRVGPQERILSVSQTFPWFGTLGSRTAATDAAADAADAGVQAGRLAVETEVRAAWYRLGALEEEVARVKGAADLATATVDYLRAAYESGGADYAGLLKAEMEAARLVTLAVNLEDRRRPLTAALNAAAGLPTGTPPPRAALPDSSLLGAELPPDPALRDLLQAGNPELAALSYRRESSRLGAEAVGKANNPSFTLGLDWIVTGEAVMPDVPDSGKDPVIARLAVQLPVWGGGNGAEDRAAAGRVRSAGADLSDRRRQLEARLEQALYAWRDARRSVELYSDNLLPRGRQAVDVARSHYETGDGSFAGLLEARRTLLELETEIVRRHLDLALALNEVAHLVGVEPKDLIGASAPDHRKDSP